MLKKMIAVSMIMSFALTTMAIAQQPSPVPDPKMPPMPSMESPDSGDMAKPAGTNVVPPKTPAPGGKPPSVSKSPHDKPEVGSKAGGSNVPSSKTGSSKSRGSKSQSSKSQSSKSKGSKSRSVKAKGIKGKKPAGKTIALKKPIKKGRPTARSKSKKR